MDPTLPSQILETLRANRDQILTHWQQARPELQSLASATLDDMKVELFDKQGQSRTTFLVSVGDHDAVMTVETPDPYTFSKRAQASTRDALKQAWLENKIPVANPIGNSFDMTFGEQNYQCELSEFCHGYQLEHMYAMPAAGVKSLAHALARSHIVGENIETPDQRPPFTFKVLNLPYGLVHNDIHRDNLILNPNTHKVAAIVDFERAKHLPFVAELGEVAGQFVKVERDPERMEFDIQFSDSLRSFITNYNDIRPLTSREWGTLKATIFRGVWRACIAENRDTVIEQSPETMFQNLTEDPALHTAIARDAWHLHSQISDIVNELRAAHAKEPANALG